MKTTYGEVKEGELFTSVHEGGLFARLNSRYRHDTECIIIKPIRSDDAAWAGAFTSWNDNDEIILIEEVY